MNSKFLWGVATSSHQIEGQNDSSDWSEWETAGNIAGGAVSGKATDHVRLFKEDIKLIADLGCNTYRFSFEWSRLIPKKGQVNLGALDWYHELLDECARYNIKPMATLLHFTLPLWLSKESGLTSPNFLNYFTEYVSLISNSFSKKIPLFCTINEPVVWVIGGYLGKFMPPAQYDPIKLQVAFENCIYAHDLAYTLLKKSNHEVQVGFAHNWIDFKPLRRFHPFDIILKSQAHHFYNLAWFKVFFSKKNDFSIPVLIPKIKTKKISPNLKTDFVGLNYYTRAYTSAFPKVLHQEKRTPLPIGLDFAIKNEEQSDLGWSIHPEGLKEAIQYISSTTDLPIYITENGIADKADNLRPQYLQRHLEVIAKLIQENHKILGYYHWSLIDNFEWIDGFGPRFGLVEVNYENFERTPRHSYYIYKNWIRGISDKDNVIEQKKS